MFSIFSLREYIDPFFSSLRAKMIANISDPEEHKQARKMLASV
jgi:hypothetical protein